MTLNQVEVGSTYEMVDGRKLKIVREWTAENGHTRVEFDVIEGSQAGFLDCSKAEFQAKATQKV
jgi:hypothetical protein